MDGGNESARRYCGDLVQILSAASERLSPGGYLVFTVEAADPDDTGSGFHLGPHGRYAHTEAYIRDTLGNAGLAVRSLDTAILRQEKQMPVTGLVVSAQRPRG